MKCDCKDNPNCYYKQLARKTEECESLKKDIEEKNNFINKLGISAGGEFNRIKVYIDNLTSQNQQYKQALEEIDSIAGQINLTIMGGEKSPKAEWVQLYTVTICRILEKCSEVLNVR